MVEVDDDIMARAGQLDGDGIGDVCDSTTIVIPPGTFLNDNITLQPGESAAIGAGAEINGNLEGDASNIVSLGPNVAINGNVIGIGTLRIDGPNVLVNGNFVDTVNGLLVAGGASVSFTGGVIVEDLTVENDGGVNIPGNLDFSGTLTMGPGASLAVGGNLQCGPSAAVAIDPTAIITVNGNDNCPATP